MMQQVLSNTSKILIDQKSGSNLLYLPLDKLIQTDGGASKPPVTTPTQVTPEVPDVSTRTRESFRSREREIR